MQRGRPSGTATSAVPSRGTSVHPSKRAARARYSAVKSGDDVKIALSTSSGRKPLPSWRARNSSAVAFRIASRVLAAAVVAPRSPRRVLVMALADQLRLMVLTDAALLKGRDVVAECRQAARGGATMIQVRLKDAPPRDVAALTRSLVGALAIPVIVNDRVDVALAAGAAGAHLARTTCRSTGSGPTYPLRPPSCSASPSARPRRPSASAAGGRVTGASDRASPRGTSPTPARRPGPRGLARSPRSPRPARPGSRAAGA